MKVRFAKITGELLRPVDDETAEFVAKLKLGEVIHADFTRMRCYEFHKKWIALAKYAYDHWEPGELQDPKWKDVVPEKSFDRFRKDLTIMAGYYDATYRIDGSVRIEAKSISFAKMSNEEFEQLYSNTIDVVLKHILVNYEKGELEAVLMQVMGFA